MARKAPDVTTFGAEVAAAYATKGGAIELGTAKLDDALLTGAAIRLPLATMNRHGLIAGATGTAKTRTLQLIAEQRSAAGVSVFTADVKGDLSGMAMPGSSDGPARKRASELGLPYEPTGYPVEYLSLGGIGPGVPVRAAVSDFGPLPSTRSTRPGSTARAPVSSSRSGSIRLRSATSNPSRPSVRRAPRRLRARARTRSATSCSRRAAGR